MRRSWFATLSVLGVLLASTTIGEVHHKYSVELGPSGKYAYIRDFHTDDIDLADAFVDGEGHVTGPYVRFDLDWDDDLPTVNDFTARGRIGETLLFDSIDLKPTGRAQGPSPAPSAHFVDVMDHDRAIFVAESPVGRITSISGVNAGFAAQLFQDGHLNLAAANGLSLDAVGTKTERIDAGDSVQLQHEEFGQVILTLWRGSGKITRASDDILLQLDAGSEVRGAIHAFPATTALMHEAFDLFDWPIDPSPTAGTATQSSVSFMDTDCDGAFQAAADQLIASAVGQPTLGSDDACLVLRGDLEFPESIELRGRGIDAAGAALTAARDMLLVAGDEGINVADATLTTRDAIALESQQDVLAAGAHFAAQSGSLDISASRDIIAPESAMEAWRGLRLTAGNDVTLVGTTIQAGQGAVTVLASQGTLLASRTIVSASEQVTFTAAEGNFYADAASLTSQYDAVSVTAAAGSITAPGLQAISTGNIELLAGRDLAARGANLQTTVGTVTLTGQHSVHIDDARVASDGRATLQSSTGDLHAADLVAEATAGDLYIAAAGTMTLDGAALTARDGVFVSGLGPAALVHEHFTHYTGTAPQYHPSDLVREGSPQ